MFIFMDERGPMRAMHSKKKKNQILVCWHVGLIHCVSPRAEKKRKAAEDSNDARNSGNSHILTADVNLPQLTSSHVFQSFQVTVKGALRLWDDDRKESSRRGATFQFRRVLYL